jgi:TadE-like protein
MLATIRRIARIAGGEGGEQLVEFAICATLFITILLGIADACRCMYAYHFVTYGAQQGARYAEVRGASWGSSCSTSAPPSFTLGFNCEAASTDVSNFVKSLGGLNQNNLTVSTTWPATTPDCSSSCSACTTSNSQGCMVKVKVTYAFTFLVPFYKKTSVNLSATSQKVIQM